MADWRARGPTRRQNGLQDFKSLDFTIDFRISTLISGSLAGFLHVFVFFVAN